MENRKNNSPQLSLNKTNKLYVDQVNLLYQNAPVAFVTSMLLSIIVCLVLLDVVNSTHIFAWLGISALLVMLRGVSVYHYKNRNIDTNDQRKWLNIFLLGSFCSGMMWGLLILFLFPESTVYQLFIVFVIAGICSGAVVAFASRKEALLVYLFPILTPLAVVMIQQNDKIHIAMGIMLIIYAFSIMKMGIIWHKNITRTLSMRYENQELVESLLTANDETNNVKSRIELILNSAVDGICGLDNEKRFTFVNPSALSILGFELNELIGRNFSHILCTNSKTLENSFNPNQLLHCEQIKLKANMGDCIPAEITCSPIFDDKGELKGSVVIFQDISSRLNAEAQQKDLEQQLHQSQKMQAIGQLTGGIAHDFNNMLASIMGYCELAKEKVQSMEDEKLKDYLHEVYHSGERARDLITQMLTFSRGNSGDSKPQNVVSLTDESLKMLRSILPSSISIDRNLDNQIPYVLADPINLQQIVMNLCINARDAMNEKGSISIELQLKYIEGTTCTSCHNKFSGEYVELSVSDNGEGIRAENLPHIFEPFYSTKDVGKGTGMGLPVVHGIIHGHGGHIVVISNREEGTTVKVYFQVAEKASQKTEENKNLSKNINATFSGNVMVVDDEESVGGFAREFLESKGYHVSLFTDPEEAIAKFKLSPTDVDFVFTDQVMPKLSGIEFAKELLSIRAELPIVICTGYSESLNEQEANEIGIKAICPKPMSGSELLHIISKEQNKFIANL